MKKKTNMSVMLALLGFIINSLAYGDETRLTAPLMEMSPLMEVPAPATEHKEAPAIVLEEQKAANPEKNSEAKKALEISPDERVTVLEIQIQKMDPEHRANMLAGVWRELNKESVTLFQFLKETPEYKSLSEEQKEKILHLGACSFSRILGCVVARSGLATLEKIGIPTPVAEIWIAHVLHMPLAVQTELDMMVKHINLFSPILKELHFPSDDLAVKANLEHSNIKEEEALSKKLESMSEEEQSTFVASIFKELALEDRDFWSKVKAMPEYNTIPQEQQDRITFLTASYMMRTLMSAFAHFYGYRSLESLGIAEILRRPLMDSVRGLSAQSQVWLDLLGDHIKQYLPILLTIGRQ